MAISIVIDTARKNKRFRRSPERCAAGTSEEAEAGFIPAVAAGLGAEPPLQ